MRLLGRRAMLLFSCVAVSNAFAAQAHKVPSHSGEGSKRAGDYHSPDGKYLVRVFIGEGDTTDLQIYPAPRSQHGKKTSGLLPQPISDSAGYLWVPGKSHTLVVGVSGLYGEAKLALWDEGNKLRLLRQAKSPADETFVLDAVSSDGRTVYYSHGKAEQAWKTYAHGSLSLL